MKVYWNVIISCKFKFDKQRSDVCTKPSIYPQKHCK